MGGLIHDSLNSLLVLNHMLSRIENHDKKDLTNNGLRPMHLTIDHITRTLRAIQSISRVYYQQISVKSVSNTKRLLSIVDKFRSTHESIIYKCQISHSLDLFNLPLGILDFMVGELLENSTKVCVSTPNAKIRLFINVKIKDRIISIKCLDTGPGFPDKILELIQGGQIKPPTDKDIGGYGLYIVHEIVNRIEGTILVSNIDKNGACIEIILPV